MGFKDFIRKVMFRREWTCVSCGVELFGEEYFCPDCIKKLPFIGANKCNHCGRSALLNEEYCDTCKNFFTSVDIARSVFDYRGKIAYLIQKFKFNGEKHLATVFAKYMLPVMLKNFPRTDFITFVPMTEKARKKRRYNQTELLANELSMLSNVPCYQAVTKKKETQRQVKLGKAERLKNLQGAFSVIDKKLISGKKILLIDDVLTTGATAQAIACLLKDKGAEQVYLLTISSVPDKSIKKENDNGFNKLYSGGRKQKKFKKTRRDVG